MLCFPWTIYLLVTPFSVKETHQIIVGDFNGELYTHLEELFFPRVYSMSPIKHKICFTPDGLLLFLKDRIKEITLERPLEENGNFIEYAYRSNFSRKQAFIISRILDIFDVQFVGITADETRIDDLKKIAWLAYRDLEKLRSLYEKTSYRIRREASGTLVSSLFLSAHQTSPESQFEKASSFLTPELTQRLSVKNSEFSKLIRDNRIEKQYELFLKKYPWLLNIQYINLTDAGSLRFDDIDLGGIRETDLYLAEKIYGICDIWELKRPRHNIFTKKIYRKGVLSLTTEISGAVNQVTQYMHLYMKSRQSIYSIPSGYVLAGNLEQEAREKGVPVDSLRDNLGVFNNMFHNVKIITYDYIIRQNQKVVSFNPTSQVRGTTPSTF